MAVVEFYIYRNKGQEYLLGQSMETSTVQLGVPKGLFPQNPDPKICIKRFGYNFRGKSEKLWQNVTQVPGNIKITNNPYLAHLSTNLNGFLPAKEVFSYERAK